MLQIAPRRRLRSFRDVTKHVGIDRQLRRLAKSLNLPEAQNPKVDLNYFTLFIPMGLSDEEKSTRLSEMVDTVSAIEDSDIILLGMWISPTAE